MDNCHASSINNFNHISVSSISNNLTQRLSRFIRKHNRKYLAKKNINNAKLAI